MQDPYWAGAIATAVVYAMTAVIVYYRERHNLERKHIDFMDYFFLSFFWPLFWCKVMWQYKNYRRIQVLELKFL